jgi:serine phosphatase RsbU (regulator of sigma subunit)/CheY-like chemotaxis protein/anti-sigma regulatory factor (Ser/Thr protein kinase)
MRLQLQRILSAHYDVLTAADGEAALEVARRVEPALIVTDVMMPRLDGFGLVNALRADADLAMIPVVMLSARAGIEAAGEGLLAGAGDYLIKPFRSRDLLTRVAARLDAAARTRSWHDEEVGAAGRAAVHAHLAEAVSGAMSIKDVVVAVRASPLSTLGATTASVGVIDAASDLITIEYADAIDPLFDPLFSDRYHTVAGDAPVPMAQAIRDDDTLVLTGPPDDTTADTPWAVSPGRSKGASVSVPLHGSEGAVIGAFTLIWPAPRQFTADDIEMVEESARLVGRAIERLITAEREHRMATELQDRLLDLDRRATTAVISAVYQSASDALRVGGDWYTATRLDADGLGVSVGDVVGHGLPAVAAMSQLRSALGAAALTSPEPDQVIDVIELYAQTLPGAVCATLAYAVLDPTTTTLRYTCAGHPYPLVVRPDGSTTFLEDGRRPPLGTRSYASARSIGHVDLPKGSLLILYTDGLIERRGESLDAGLARLAGTAASLAQAPASEAAATLLRQMAPPDGFSDDVALVALRPAGTCPTSFVEVVPADMAEVGPLRHRLGAWLKALGLADQVVVDVLIGVGEAVTNAMEHGSQMDPTRRVSVEVFADQDVLLASVSDTGRWRYSPELPRSPYRGRGLRLIGALAEDVVTVRAAEGTRVTMTYRRAGG